MTTYTLYGRRDAGSLAPEAAFAVAGVPVRLIDVGKAPDGGPPPDLLAVNPRGQVPAVVMPDGAVLTECPAIMAHIADAFPASRLAPPPGSPARAQHDRWVAFLQANVYEGLLRSFYADRYTTDPTGAAGVKAAADAYVELHLGLIEDALPESGPWFGGSVTNAELLLWMFAQWTDADRLARACPRIAALVARVAAHPAVAPVAARHYGEAA
jgi:glutathione S-transferase